ncbi:MAG: hypothetical protein P8Y27_06140 [Chromatiaceae bacterium]|jgi:hypothetical protein
MTTEFDTGPVEAVERTSTGATDALRHGAAAGAQAAADIWPAVGRVWSRTVYGACYYTAYGATFGALAVASLVPKGSMLEKGFHEGAEAGREAFHEWEEPTGRSAAEEFPEPVS